MTGDSEIRRAALLRAQAALDGELDAANALAYERERASNASLRYAEASGELLRRALRAHVAREAAPERLRQRVLALAEPPASRQRTLRPEPRLMALAASFVAVAFLAGFFFGARQGVSSEDLALRPLVDSFARAEISGQPFDVASSDRHTVKPWLASRLTLGAEVVDLAEAGFPLAGGRIDIVDQAPVPTLVYRHREHWIDVSELPAQKQTASTAVEALDIRGFRVRRWRDAAHVYVAVSDMDAGELDTFVDDFRHRANQGVEPSPH
jgi:anti-sigma factor RsiW